MQLLEIVTENLWDVALVKLLEILMEILKVLGLGCLLVKLSEIWKEIVWVLELD